MGGMNEEDAVLRTFDGHLLTAKEAAFINLYLSGAKLEECVKKAGYSQKDARKYGKTLLKRKKIIEEIQHRNSERKSESIADGKELMELWTKIIRRQITDSYGMEVSIQDVLAASKELAKRTIDVDTEADKAQVVTLKIDWGGDSG